MIIKLQLTPPPSPNTPEAYTPNASAQYSGSTNSYLQHSLGNQKFAPYSATTMEKQKKKENKLMIKTHLTPPPAPNIPGAYTPNSSAQDYVSTDSYIPYSFINRNQYCKIVPNTQKNMTPNTDVPDADAHTAAGDDSAYHYSLHNRKNNKNKITPNTDVPENDSPDASDYDAASPDSLILDFSLKRKIDLKSMLKL